MTLTDEQSTSRHRQIGKKAKAVKRDTATSSLTCRHPLLWFPVLNFSILLSCKGNRKHTSATVQHSQTVWSAFAPQPPCT